jgi:hypothetical protein
MGFIKWFKDLWNKFIVAFNEFIEQAFSEATKIAIGMFSAFALKVVIELAATDLTSTAKRAEAFKKIKDEAIKQGKTLSDSVINLLIELAVEKYKTTVATKPTV